MSKLRLIPFSTFCLIIGASCAQAFEPYKPIVQEPHRFNVGFDVFSRDVTYDRPGWPADIPLPHEDATMTGARARYDYQKIDDFYVGLEGRWATGKSRSSEGDSDNELYDVEGRLGYTISMAPRIHHLISFYVAVGQSRWDREPRGTGPDEKFEWVYVGAGVRGEREIGERLTVGFNAKITYPVDNEAKIKLSEADPGLRNVSAEFGDQVQVELEVPFTFNAERGLLSSVRVVPFYYNKGFSDGDNVPIRNTAGDAVGTIFFSETDIYAWGATIELVSKF